MEILPIKQRFGIIGNSPLLDRAIDVARQVASTEITVLIYGESGTGKEVFPKIIHHLSSRKHGSYIAVNCGAIPEGTIDSELFGHEKGSFTGAHEGRKGYFEVVNKGTIFLDEVADLPLSTQVRLLRVLETGEFMKVGSSATQKTDVRVVAASNISIPDAIRNGRFREDLYYRLNTVPVYIPALRERKEDILLLFRKFAADFAEKYRMPPLQLDNDARKMMEDYRWPGNIRQLKNLTEQISIIENSRIISPEILAKYLPRDNSSDLPVLFRSENSNKEISERDILYKVLFDMKKDINDLKKIVFEIMEKTNTEGVLKETDSQMLRKFNEKFDSSLSDAAKITIKPREDNSPDTIDESEVIDAETLSLDRNKAEIIRRALKKYNNKKKAAKELGISERTLYRKLKDYGIE